ncbi:ribose-5-phosphate isomerase RpiA [Methanonatronarchaeum sp. AMET6-2]|uniref:ribose-5-phosphate isomerase RpiA n=1 Tax=Methanonatronarchaeum sp. AMET6-2 TaxID=2933293 RepID=UPI001214E1D3|nr:ribose-5-phosphate isomerase RpiA [Methanonatronarchaeum sp. AMET6-2]RZN61268.1 MAG: ribose-5-phosphate isomerase RpiA [Methanonatronarchaeia archaeon]UOY10247.1 ribose-5-phosphate isomerase RpiA [Methanonatronarchaeum sp. AMET6-2]
MSVKRIGDDEGKRVVAGWAADLVEPGMVVGFGTGSTVAAFLREVADRGLDVVGVSTSFETSLLARELGVPIRSIENVDGVDLAVDGADQVDGDLNLIKGGGAAHFREKVVGLLGSSFVVIVDETKVDPVLDLPVPVEVAPFAVDLVEREVVEMGGRPVVRSSEGKDGPLVTDNGNFVLDCDFGEIENPVGLGRRLGLLCGVVEHGLFCGLADRVLVGSSEGVREL